METALSPIGNHNIFKAFENYKSELYGIGKRKQLSHKQRQKRKRKRRISKK